MLMSSGLLPAQVVEQVDAGDQAQEAVILGDDRDLVALEDRQQRRERLASGARVSSRAVIAVGDRLAGSVAGIGLHGAAAGPISSIMPIDLPSVQHRQLGDVGQPHAPVGGQQGIAGPTRDDAAFVVAPRDQVAQVAVAGSRQQPWSTIQ